VTGKLFDMQGIPAYRIAFRHAGVAFPACTSYGTVGPPARIAPGQASYDYLWFGSISNVFFMKQKTDEQYQCQWGFVTEIN